MKPLFRDLDEGDEREDGYSEPFGFLLGPMGVMSRDEMADQYFQAANLIVEKIRSREIADYEVAFPVLYLYRHSMELLLKAILGSNANHHRLNALADDLVKFTRKRAGEDVPQWITGRLKELARIDPTSEAFRYGEDKYDSKKRSGIPVETYVRVLELHVEMNRIYLALRRALLVVQERSPEIAIR